MGSDILRETFDALRAERQTIIDASAPKRAERDTLTAQRQALEVQEAEITAQIREIEAPLFELDNQIGTFAKALGARTMVDNPE